MRELSRRETLSLMTLGDVVSGWYYRRTKFGRSEESPLQCGHRL
jgi:hypothetical protein